MEDGRSRPLGQAKAELQAIVGSANVVDEQTVLDEHSSDLSLVSGPRPLCIVRPGCASEVQAVVRLANAIGTPLVPVSSGPPHFRGDTVPSAAESVMLDLSRMKRIIRIDAVNCVALVEPGVTFAELQPELRKAGLTAYLPLAPRASKSVAGSILEREPITQPNYHWDSLDPLLCAEMVLGTGDMLRTGEAAGPDAIEEQWEIGKAQLNPFGPGQYDQNRIISGAQGTIGVVTWASVKCRPLPDATRAFLVPADTIEPLISVSYQLVRQRLGNHCFIVNALNLACLMAEGPAGIRALRAALPPWVLVVTFEGAGDLAADKLAYQEADFRDVLAAEGLQAHEAEAGIRAEELHAALGRASAEPNWKVRYKGGAQELLFLSTLDKSPRFIEAVNAAAGRSGVAAEDTGVYLQMIVQGTSCHCGFDFYYDPADQAAAGAASRAITSSSQAVSEAGAFFSRPYPQWAALAYAQATTTSILQRKLKAIFDPNGILNPGKLCFQGV